MVFELILLDVPPPEDAVVEGGVFDTTTEFSIDAGTVFISYEMYLMILRTSSS